MKFPDNTSVSGLMMNTNWDTLGLKVFGEMHLEIANKSLEIHS